MIAYTNKEHINLIRLASHFLLFFIFITLINCTEDPEPNPPYAILTEEQAMKNKLFASILLDTDTFSILQMSLDTFAIDSIQCNDGSGAYFTCDSAFYNFFDADMWIKPHDTFLLKERRIKFLSNGFQLELENYNQAPYPYIEFAAVWYDEKDICCEVAQVFEVDTDSGKVFFSLTNHQNRIRFFATSKD